MVLIPGMALRVFDVEGRLLWRLDPPGGEETREAVWTADGKGIVYTTGPFGFTLPE